MAERRRGSLLDFAIAATLAVVPVLLAILLGIGAAAPSWQQRLAADSHASVRQVAALKTFEHAIVRRDSVRSGAPTASEVVALIPECAMQWSGRERAIDRLRELFGYAPNDTARARRIATQLVVLDEALARMSAEDNRRVLAPVGFDLLRWAEAARLALASPVESAQYPGHRFEVRCADLAGAVTAMSREDGRMLAALAWRGTEVDRIVERWRGDQVVSISARHVARGNPWGGIPGCIYLWSGTDGDAVPAYFVTGRRAANERVCQEPALVDAAAGRAPVPLAGEPRPDLAADDPRWRVPPSLNALLQPLDVLMRPSGALYRSYADAAHRIAVNGAPVEVGFSVDLTIDPALQALAQKSAACYTGRQDVCRALGIRRAEDGAGPIGAGLIERAVVRMAAIAIIDVPSGRIEALAGALSPCTRQAYDGPGRSTDCDTRLPYPVRYRPDALLNAAVYHDAMPASLVKPVMAAAFLGNASVGPRWLAQEQNAMRTPALPADDSLRGQLARSNSARFLDRMFCADQKFAPCARPWEVRTTALAFGWNDRCTVTSERCGHRDLLFGRSASADPHAVPVASVPYGRLLVEPVGAAGSFRERAAIALDTTKIARCAHGADGRRASADDWEKCKGGVVVDVVAEGWGQGHARATALGAAGMMATLAAAANGQPDARKPHLIRALRGVDGIPAVLADELARSTSSVRERNALSREAAEVILSGLSYSHRRGTARLACEQVFDARLCREVDWVAGKTGTPTFPNDERTLDELAKLCAPGVKRTRGDETACGGLRPYKWYVAAYRTDRANPVWSKAIGVLTERNWLADTGRIHGAGDHGPNPAAELAFQIIARHRSHGFGDVR